MSVLPLTTTYVTTDLFYQMVIILGAGIIAALIYTVYNKLMFGRFINAMREAGAVGEDNAISLSELGFEGNRHIRYSLRSNATLSRKIKQNEKGYYLSSDDLEELAKRYDSKSINARDMLLTLVVLITVFIALWLVIPALTEWINTTILG